MRATIVGAWYTAAFTRQKKLQPLAQLLKRLEPQKKKEPQTAEQMEAIARAWVKHMGGTFKKRPKP